MLSDIERRLYTSPGEYIDSDHPALRKHAAWVTACAPTDEGKAQCLYLAVRDEIRYDPYLDYGALDVYRASSVLEARRGYCVGKASLFAALARAIGLPARIGFADVRNHLATKRLLETVGSDVFAWHGYVEVYLGDRWVKVTPTFNDTLCAKLGVAPLPFDGTSDALLQPFDAEGRQFMAYLNDHGTFHDVPAKFLVGEMARLYPKLCASMAGQGELKGDMEREAEEDAAAMRR